MNRTMEQTIEEEISCNLCQVNDDKCSGELHFIPAMPDGCWCYYHWRRPLVMAYVSECDLELLKQRLPLSCVDGNHVKVRLQPAQIVFLHRHGHGLRNGRQQYHASIPWFGLSDSLSTQVLSTGFQTALQALLATMPDKKTVARAMSTVLKGAVTVGEVASAAGQVTTGVLAIIGSAGAGGDIITNIIFAIINAALAGVSLGADMLTTLAGQDSTFGKLLELRFNRDSTNPVADIIERTYAIIRSASQELRDSMVSFAYSLLSLFETIAGVFIDWVTAFIPLTAGAIGVTVKGSLKTITTVVSVALSSLLSRMFGMMLSAFNMLPRHYQELFYDSRDMRKFVLEMFAEIKTRAEWTSNIILEAPIRAITGTITMLTYGHEQQNSYVDQAMKVLDVAMPLTFVLMAFMQAAFDLSTIEVKTTGAAMLPGAKVSPPTK